MDDIQEQPKRKLASVQKITDIFDIEGADKIQGCRVLGWECVVRKTEGYKVGDLVVYCETDSIMPEKPEFEFLRERHFRIKIIRLKKQICEGIVFPLSILPPNEYKEGDDVGEIIGVKKHDPQLQEEKALAEQNTPKSKINKFFMNFGLYRFIYFRLNRKDKGWPSNVPHTDEERIETILSVVTSRPNSEWYVTEKVDGSSGTFYIGTKRTWGIKKLFFGVCSRNIRLSKPDNSAYWKMAIKYDIEKKLLTLKRPGIVCQGECMGGKIQGNKYQLKEPDFFVFNVIDNGTKYSLEKMVEFCKEHGFKTVPIISESWVFRGEGRTSQEIIKEITDMSIGKSKLNPDIWREGIVVRLKSNPNISFKKINPRFSLEYNQ